MSTNTILCLVLDQNICEYFHNNWSDCAWVTFGTILSFRHNRCISWMLSTRKPIEMAWMRWACVSASIDREIPGLPLCTIYYGCISWLQRTWLPRRLHSDLFLHLLSTKVSAIRSQCCTLHEIEGDSYMRGPAFRYTTGVWLMLFYFILLLF